MGKRSDFERLPRNYYQTPVEAVRPLLRHLKRGTRFIEPCAGGGALIEHLEAAGHDCLLAYDLEPQALGVEQQDALTFEPIVAAVSDCFITNPPWSRDVLHPLIIHLSDQLPTWLLIDADWKHTRQAAPFANRLRDIQSIGRVKWIPDSTMTGKDNCAWYLFSRPGVRGATFHMREAA